MNYSTQPQQNQKPAKASSKAILNNKPSKVLPLSRAPEHAAVGVDDRELAEIVGHFHNAQQSMNAEEDRIHHLFDAPKAEDVVRLNDKAMIYQKNHGWMTQEQARASIAEWKGHCAAQRLTHPNADKVVLSLFDKSGAWSCPWEEAGYQVYRFDIQDNCETGDVNLFSVDFFGDWFGDFDGLDIYAILAACPCTDFAGSGARHFAAKDADGRTVASVQLVHQTLRVIEYFRPVVWAIENPVGRIERLGGLSPWRLSFDPFHIGETYTKKTLLWGRFNADLPVAPVEPVEGSKMHKQYGGSSMATKNARSVTPEGFAYAFFMANNAVDHPAMAISGKYDRLCSRLVGEAVKHGLCASEIDDLVEDAYFMELDDAQAEQFLRDELTLRGAVLDSYEDMGGQAAMWF
ncbi:DNA cytosine methyltransferase [Pseudomonas proteolytica]|uniref:DNA cytosine methyltransferase n=1 Tax=Pseudomonas proteolytica TaxID=219574 RepID=UPI0021CC9E0B|nr:DNA cytosine methyltransferase [Pseudomonas proteolytica]